MESGSYWLDKVRISIWRDVRTLAIEEAYTTKYSIHPGADQSKEVEYQGSSRLLLQPELPESIQFQGVYDVSKSMVSDTRIVREICEVFVDLKLASGGLSFFSPFFKWQDLGFIPSDNVVLSSTYVGKILGADQLLVILCYRYQESGIGYWILSMTISGSGEGEHHEVRRSG
ncbi:hypothetical protein Tco_1236947 [Tanacetum coccineum]